MKPARMSLRVWSLAATLSVASVGSAHAGDLVEKEGVAIGVTAGNMWFLPLKASAVVNGVLSGGLSFLLTGGDLEVARQMWQNTTQGPYVITPELARKAMGDRPELREQKD